MTSKELQPGSSPQHMPVMSNSNDDEALHIPSNELNQLPGVATPSIPTTTIIHPSGSLEDSRPSSGSAGIQAETNAYIAESNITPKPKTKEADEEAKRAIRKATQQRYLAKRKIREEETVQAIENAEQEREDLKVDNEMLKAEHGILFSLISYKNDVMITLHRLAQSAANGISQAAAWTMGAITPQNFLINHPNLMTENYIRLMASKMTWKQFLEIRAKKFELCVEYIDQWRKDVANRPAIEKKLTAMLHQRCRILRVAYQLHPEFSRRLFSSFLLPAGSPSDPIPYVNPKLTPVYSQLEITPEQRSQLLNYLDSYKAKMASIHAELQRVTQKVVAMAAVRDYNSVESAPTTHRAANEYLDMLSATAEMAKLSEEDLATFTDFDVGCWNGLSALQLAMILTTCYPYIADPFQVCEMVRVKSIVEGFLSESDSGRFIGSPSSSPSATTTTNS